MLSFKVRVDTEARHRILRGPPGGFSKKSFSETMFSKEIIFNIHTQKHFFVSEKGGENDFLTFFNGKKTRK